MYSNLLGSQVYEQTHASTNLWGQTTEQAGYIHVYVYQNLKYRLTIIICMAAVTEEPSAIYSINLKLYPTQITFAAGIDIWHHHCVTCRLLWYDTWRGHAYILQFYLLYHIAELLLDTNNIGR